MTDSDRPVSPYYQDEWLRVYLGDCREVMAALESESVHCVVTSPPYWGLRDYGTATWTGGDEACDHEPDRRSPSSTLQGGKATQGQGRVFRGSCGWCGASRTDSQLGLEPTPEEYVADMVAVFREVWRVLRKDGTVWLNLGDSYAAGGGSGTQRLDELGARLGTGGGHKHSSHPSGRAPSSGLAQKQLVGIPWRVAFALQADGWYLRSDIIWSKPNPMPESVTDRPTKAHEYLFLLSKLPRYYYDADAVRQPVSPSTHMRISQNVAAQIGSARANGGAKTNGNMKAVIRAPKTTEPGQGIKNNHSFADATALPVIDRNLRSVWTIATQPYPGAHFATFPRALVEPCIKAGCPEGGVVLDPFAGSGTTGAVAQALSRKAVLIDLSADYLRQLMDRNRDIPLGLELPA